MPGCRHWPACLERERPMTMQPDAKGMYAAPADFVGKGACGRRLTTPRCYAASVADPEAFWARRGPADRLDQALHQGQEHQLRARARSTIKWFEDGTLNVSANCIDRHMISRANQTAIIWEPDDPKTPAQHITYAKLLEETSRMANVLKAHGRQPWRPGGDLSADDPRGGLCDAGLRADRGDPFHRLRGLLARRAGQPDQRFRGQGGDHRRFRARAAARRPR